MDAEIRAALERDRTIDITTTGRLSGLPRRIEIWFYNVDGRIYLSGTPGRRDWYANLQANPDLGGAASGDVEGWVAGSPIAEVEFEAREEPIR